MELLIYGNFIAKEFELIIGILISLSVVGTLLFFLLGILSKDWIFKGFAGHSTYECGFLPYSNTRIKLDVNFAPVAIFFIIFDIEAIFLLPVVVDWEYISYKGEISVLFFLIFFGLSLIYEIQSKILKI